MISTATAAYLVLFITVAVGFVFAALLLGRFPLRANAPTRQKLETYECGEPAIGPSWVKFDLRFYTVALVFLIFDVEVAFFFPWAAVFGTSTPVDRPRTDGSGCPSRLDRGRTGQPSNPQRIVHTRRP